MFFCDTGPNADNSFLSIWSYLITDRCSLSSMLGGGFRRLDVKKRLRPPFAATSRRCPCRRIARRQISDTSSIRQTGHDPRPTYQPWSDRHNSSKPAASARLSSQAVLPPSRRLLRSPELE
uniref:(northern house mosquito) hypothetical protein n=1 Tax=Culex pipiens TaxID=7175 RepID=A0A8D8CIB7_CULPI